VLEEVTDLPALLNREQFYLDTLAPHFNLSTSATVPIASPEGKERQRAAGRARLLDPYYRTILDTGRATMWADPTHRQRMSERFTGRVFSEETRAKMSVSKTGTVTSPETRAKQSVALKGKPKTPEHVEKVAAASRGLIRTPEARTRMSEAQRRRYQRPDERALNARRLARARAIRYGKDLNDVIA
jgi:hypothetical protein